jgi:hypothetical protein
MAVKLSKRDINAIANSRYFSKVGMKLVIGMIAIMVVMYMLVTWVSAIPSYVFYIVMGLAVLALIMIYDRGQRALFKKYWKRLEDAGFVTKDELEEDNEELK